MLKVASFFKEENDPFFRRGEAMGEEKKNYEFVSNLLLANRFTMTEIADFAKVDIAFVQKVRAELAKTKK